MKLEEFREFAKNHNVIPVYRKLLADGETPLMRDACPSVLGFIFNNFSVASFDKDTMLW